MNYPIQRLVFGLLAAALLLFPGPAPAQTQANTTLVPPASFHILEQNRVRIGDHTITYNRVSPPVFAASIATLTPAPTPATSPSPFQQPPPGTQTAFSFTCFSAVIYDGEFTVLRWHGSGGEFFAVSSANFNYFSGGPAEFLTVDTDYTFFMALDDESASSADATTSAWLAQASQALPAGQAGYLIVSGSASPDGLLALQDFHAFYNSNETALATAYQQRQAANAARLRRLREHTAVAPNTVVNYWKIYPEGAR